MADIPLSNGKTWYDAPDDQSVIDSYLKENGLNRADAPKKGWMDTLFGLGKSAATGLGKGVGDLIAAGGASEPEMTGAKPEGVPDFNQTEKILGEQVGGWHQPEGLGERAVEGGARMLPSAIAAPGEGNFLARMFTYGAAPGALSELAGTAAKNLPFGQYTENPARIATAALSPGAIRKAITPNTISDPTRLAANATLAHEMPGVQTAGQAVNSSKLMGRELTSNPHLNEHQAEDFTRAVTRGAGNETPHVTLGPDGTVAQGLRQASDAIERMAQTSTIDLGTPGNTQRLNQFWAQRSTQPYQARIAGIVDDTLHRATPFRNQQMTGVEYRRLRSALHEATENADPQEAFALRGYARALDASMDASSPHAAQGWRQAREQWENSKIVQGASSKLKDGSTTLTPQGVEQAAKKFIGEDRFTLGGPNPPPGSPRSTYTPLTRGAQKGLPELQAREPSGNDAEGLMGVLGGLGGTAAAYHYGLDPALTLDTGILSAILGGYSGKVGAVKKVADPIINRAVSSTPGQAYLRNQVLPALPQNSDQRNRAAFLRALMASQQGQQQGQ